jgi:hypothetical protein
VIICDNLILSENILPIISGLTGFELIPKQGLTGFELIPKQGLTGFELIPKQGLTLFVLIPKPQNFDFVT